MRIRDLFEDRASTIAQKQGGTLLQKAKSNGEKYTTPEEIISVLKQADPSKNSQYIQWLTTQYLRGLFRLEDTPRVHDELAKFDHIKNKLDKKDINQYTYYTLSDLVDKEFKVELQADDASVTNNGDVKVLYDGPLGNLSIPLTQEASCELGRGTKWCTAADKDNKFDDYNGKGPLYIWRDKSGDKYQFHFEEYQFMDSRDRPISKDKLKYFREEHPVIGKLFEKYEAEAIKKPYRAYYYARFVMESHWPEAEAVIASDPEYAYCYARFVMKSRWPEAEPVIATDPCWAFFYAAEVMKSRWPEAEPVIATDDMYRKWYNKKFGTNI